MVVIIDINIDAVTYLMMALTQLFLVIIKAVS